MPKPVETGKTLATNKVQTPSSCYDPETLLRTLSTRVPDIRTEKNAIHVLEVCDRSELTDLAIAKLIELGVISEYEYTEANGNHFLVIGISS